MDSIVFVTVAKHLVFIQCEDVNLVWKLILIINIYIYINSKKSREEK